MSELGSATTEEPFDGAIAVVTGSSSGIGRRAIARMLSDAGATVVLVARTAERLAAVAAALPVPWLVLAGDVSDAQFCADVAERTASDYGGIDILVSYADIYVPGDLAATDLSAVEQLVGVNVFGAMPSSAPSCRRCSKRAAATS